MTDLIVVGGGCAGLTAALYAARAGLTVLVLEGGGVGGQIASSPRVENYPGIAQVSGLAFSDALCAQAETFGATLDCSTVTGLTQSEIGFTVHTEDGDHFCKSVILATGARPRTLGLDREDSLSGVSYCAVCDGAFYRGQDVAVVGGGSSALQSAEFLSPLCRSVALIHRRESFRGEDALVRRVSALPNVMLHLGYTPVALEGEAALTGVVLADKNGATHTLPAHALFISAGRTPDNAPFSGLAPLDGEGYFMAGEDCLTGCPGLFAAGDCRTKSVRQLTTAAADGAVAALAALAYIRGV